MPSEIYTILVWSPPYDGGAPVLGYEIRLRQGGNIIERQVDCGPNLHYLASGLTIGREYLVNVRAYNEAGAGNWSKDLVIISGDLPGLVQNLTATGGDMSATLTWARPADSGSPGNFSYYIVRTLLNGTSRQTFNVSNPYLIDTGLTNKVPYHYYVYARNDVGLSNGSVDIYVVPKKPGPDLQAPMDLRAENNSFSVKLSWTAPQSDFTLLGFRIFRSLNETGVMSFLATTNRTEYTDTTVVTGWDYDYYVKAYNMVEEGQLSNGVTAHAKGETQDWLSMILSVLPYVLVMVVVIVLIVFVLGRRGKGKRKKPAPANNPVKKK
jgi:titin